MTLTIKIGFLMDFLAILGCETHFKSKLSPNSLQIDKDKLCMKFSASNININGTSLDLLGSRKPVHEGIK